MDVVTANSTIAQTAQEINQQIYTAQFKGLYLFTYSALISGTGQNLARTTVIELLKNDKVMSASHFNSGPTKIANYPVEIKMMLTMEPGEQVTIKNYNLAADGHIDSSSPMMNVANDLLHLDLSYGTFSGFQLTSLQ